MAQEETAAQQNMSDDLEQIRRARMEELRAQGNKPTAGPGAGGGSNNDDAQQDMRTSLMSQILEGAARERLSRVEMVRPERARQVEELLIRMAQSNQLRGKVSEPQLVQLLDQISAQEDRSRAKIVYNRRDSDDEFDLDASTQKEQPNAHNEEEDDDDFFD